MTNPELATIQALRSDVAYQIARHIRASGLSQTVAAKQLRLPQPTISKIMSKRVSDLSLELLIRVAVRAGILLTIQTGEVPEEAGVFVAAKRSFPGRTTKSKLGDEAREAADRSLAHLTPTERLAAFIEHNQLLHELREAGRAAETARTSVPRQRI